MRSLSLLLGDITANHLCVWEDVCRYLRYVPDKVDGKPITCHQVCERVASQFAVELAHVKGKFYGYDHSWLVFKDDPDVIIDAYPWASAGGPLLLTKTAASPWQYLYKSDAEMEQDKELMEQARPKGPIVAGPGVPPAEMMRHFDGLADQVAGKLCDPNDPANRPQLIKCEPGPSPRAPSLEA